MSPALIDIVLRFFCPVHPFTAYQEVFFKRRQFWSIWDHAQVVPLKISVGKKIIQKRQHLRQWAAVATEIAARPRRSVQAELPHTVGMKSTRPSFRRLNYALAVRV